MAKDFRITTFTEERAYHNTAILIFLKAVKSAFEHADVTIGNSLNQGYYAYVIWMVRSLLHQISTR